MSSSPPDTANSNSSDLTQGSLWKAIWVMSWPLMITTVATSLVGLVDVQVSGILGSTAQAAVGLSEHILFMFMLCLMSVGVGTTAIVSRAYGEKNTDETILATGQSLSLSVVIGMLLTLTALGAARYMLPWFSSSPELISQGAIYLSIFSLYLIPFSLVCISNAAFRAIGDSRTTLLVVGAEVIVNIAGDYLTVMGNWPVPGLGLKGIAGSAIAGAIVGTVIAVYRIHNSELRRSLEKMWPLSAVIMRRILNIGYPAALQRLSWAASVFMLFFILSKVKEPTAALASWTIGMRVEGLLFMPLMALSLAVGSIVGQNLGAKQEARAMKAGWHVTWIGVGLMVVLGILLFVFARPLAQLMSHEPITIDITTNYLYINALAEPFLAVNMILSGALQGAGDTKITMWFSIITNWLIRLPLAWFLAIQCGIGPNGAWWAMTVSVVISALLLGWRFQSGKWMKIQV